MPPFSVATFNVKDLFPVSAEAGAERAALWQAKLQEIAGRITRAQVDVVALQEVGDRPALDALLAVLGPAWQGFCAPADERGIACAVIARVPIVRAEAHRAEELPYPTFVVGDPPPFGARLSLRRAVPVLTVRSALGEVTVVCVHLKSNLPRAQVERDGSVVLPTSGRARGEGHVRSLTLRAAEALFVRGLLDQASSQSERVLIAGDFNDVPGSLALRLISGEADAVDVQPFTSVSARMPEHKRYTALFRGQPRMLDHILLSRGLFERLIEADVDLQGLRDHGPFDAGAPPTVDSDHAMVIARFRS